MARLARRQSLEERHDGDSSAFVWSVVKRAQDMEHALEDRLLRWRNEKTSSPISSASPTPVQAPLAVRQAASSSIAAITSAAAASPSSAEDRGLSNFAGSSAFSGYTAPAVTATGTGLPESIVFATGNVPPTSVPTAPPPAAATKSPSQKLTPYFIAAGSIGAFIVTLVVIYFVLRCRKRTSGGFLSFLTPRRRQESYVRQPDLSTTPPPPGEWDNIMTYADKHKDSMTFSTRSASSPSHRTDPPRAKAFTPPPPLKLARSSFIGRERGNIVRASINRHPLTTLNENAYSRSESFSNNSSSQHKPSVAQLISNGASSNTTTRPNSRKGSGTHTHTSNSSLSSGFGEGALPPPLASPLGLTPLKHLHSRQRSSLKGTSQFSWTTDQFPHLNLNAPPSSIRDSTTSDGESVARFRSVDGWVDYQSSRAERDNTPRGSPPRGAGAAGERSRSGSDSADSISTIRPLRFTEEPSSRKSWETQRESTNSLTPAKLEIHKGDSKYYPPASSARPGANSRDRDSTRTATVFRYHPGEEIKFGASSTATNSLVEAEPPASSPAYDPSPVTPYSPVTATMMRYGLQPPTPGVYTGGPSIIPRLRDRDRSTESNADVRRMDSTSTATVFRYHPGEEVPIERGSLVDSVVLDERFSGRSQV
ncbi:MAG: hypothetical protein M1817_005763 [Caeruleum heppii]|nr:MAG: hypothetical protein M1817_005763 [Caeruleum heppii]